MTYEIKYREDHEMKDSGIDWIREIPEDWDTLRLKLLFQKVKNGIWGDEEKNNSNDVYCIRVTNFNRITNDVDTEDLTIRNLDKIKQKEYLLDKNDLLLEKSGGGENQLVGFVVIYNKDIPAIYANFMARIVVKKEYNNKYLLYYFRHMYDLKVNYKHIKQTTGIQNIDSNSYLDEKIGISDINEQQKISNFLDYKTSQFDSIIEKKEKLIEKLEEAKKSLISEVVTGKVKIVDGKLVKRDKSEMKDSGVEWLGKIPKDWEVKKLKHIIKEPLMYGANESGENNNTELPRYIRITDFDLDGNLRENTFKSLEYKKATGFFLREGDILFARSGATVGKTFIFKDYEGKACFAGYLIKAVLDRNKCMPEFFYYFTKSFSYENWKKSIVIQATIENISAEKYRELQIAKPNIKEQLDINKYIEKLINDYNLTLDRNKKQIEKLKQAKQSLISEAVTGKIDLRDWEIKEIDN